MKPKTIKPVKAWAIASRITGEIACVLPSEWYAIVRRNTAATKAWCKPDERLVRVEIREVRKAGRK